MQYRQLCTNKPPWNITQLSYIINWNILSQNILQILCGNCVDLRQISIYDRSISSQPIRQTVYHVIYSFGDWDLPSWKYKMKPGMDEIPRVYFCVELRRCLREKPRILHLSKRFFVRFPRICVHMRCNLAAVMAGLYGLSWFWIACGILTVYPKKYAHGFVVLCFVVVM